MQPWLLPLPAGLCEVVSARLHVGAAAPQPLSGELGRFVLRPGLPALQSCLSHLLWHRACRLPVLPSSQPSGLHLLFAPEPSPAKIPSNWRTPGWRSAARRCESSSSRPRQQSCWGIPRAHCSSVHSTPRRRGPSQLCLHPGCLRRGLLLAAVTLRWRFCLEDQIALWIFRDERGAGGLWFWLPARTGEKGKDMLQRNPHCVGRWGHDCLRVWIRQRGSGRSQRENSFY